MIYKVKTNLKHNGTVFVPDSDIELETDIAKPLLEDGIIVDTENEKEVEKDEVSFESRVTDANENEKEDAKKSEGGEEGQEASGDESEEELEEKNDDESPKGDSQNPDDKNNEDASKEKDGENL